MDFLDAASVQDTDQRLFSTRLQPASLLHLPVEAHGQHCYSLADCLLSIHHQNSSCLAACHRIEATFLGGQATWKKPPSLTAYRAHPTGRHHQTTGQHATNNPPARASATSTCGCSAILPTSEPDPTCYPVALIAFAVSSPNLISSATQACAASVR